MKKDRSDDLRPLYKKEDFGKGIRGKYYKSYQKGSNLILLSPDVAKIFSTEKAVNETLRSLINLAQKSTVEKKRSIGRIKKLHSS
jgi:hypothetical protein